MSGNKLGIVVLILVGLILLIGATNQNQGGASFAISWWTVDGGGQIASEGGGYILSGTIGQPDTGVLSGGEYPWVVDSGLVGYLRIMECNCRY